MIHRHLDYTAGTPVTELGPAALDDLLERGDLHAWGPLARAISLDPDGELAATVARICDEHPMYGTSTLWRAFIDRARAKGEAGGGATVDLAALRREAGLTQAALALRLGISQSDLSKLERRGDLLLSTVRAYVEALGGSLGLVVTTPGRSPRRVRPGAGRQPLP